MQLFTRNVFTIGAPAEIMAYSTDMCAHVSATTGREIALWSVQFGAPAGTLAYTVRVEGVADLQETTGKLIADDDYHAKIAAGRHLIAAPAVDSLATPIHGELGDPPPVGSYAVVTSAQIANGQYAEAIGWGIDIATHVTTLTGMPVGMMMQEYGPFGTLTWIGIAADAVAVDGAAAASNGDAEYVTKLSAAGDLFVPGSGQRALATRVA